MKAKIIVFIALFAFCAVNAQTLGELSLTAAERAATEGKYDAALRRIAEAEEFYKNDAAKLPDVYYKKILILDKYYNSGLTRDPDIYKKLIDTCQFFMKSYQHIKSRTAQLKAVHAIYIKNEVPENEKKNEVSEASGAADEEADSSVGKEEKELEEEVKDLKNQLAELKEGSDQQIGVIRYKNVKDNKVTIYQKPTLTENPNLNTTAEIDSTEIEIRDGFIRELRVFTNKGRFTNRSPIPLFRFTERYKYEIDSDPPFSNYIVLGEVLSYDPALGNNYTPDNVKITLKHNGKEEKHRLTTNEGLANYIDYRIYSDFLGLMDEDTNGIVNFEASACIPLMPSNYGNTNIYFFKALRPLIRYSRFDKEDRVITPESIGEPVTSYRINNKLDLLQRSFVNAGLTLDLFTYDPQKSLILINIPFKISFNLTEVQLLEKDNITSTNYGSGIELKVSRTNNFGMTMYGYVMEVRHHHSENKNLERINPYTIYNVGSEMFFYNSKQKSSAVFLRFNYTSKFTTSHNFFQLQIGYKSSLGL